MWCSSGSRAHRCLSKLKAEIDSAVHKYGYLLIYVWVGTCDLIRKNSEGIIALRTPNSKETVHSIVREYREAVEVTRPYGDRVIIRFLDCPIFSAVKWNKCHDINDVTPLAVDRDIWNGWTTIYVLAVDRYIWNGWTTIYVTLTGCKAKQNLTSTMILQNLENQKVREAGIHIPQAHCMMAYTQTGHWQKSGASY